jgi:hypothetical protein
MLTVAELRKHVESPLEDDALRRLLDAAAEDIAQFTTVDEYITPVGNLLPLPHPAQSVTAVVENSVTLAANDYALSSSGLLLRRLDTGTNPYRTWHRSQAHITYARRTIEATKEVVQIALVQMDLRAPGIRQQTMGSWSESFGGQQRGSDYIAERGRILARLSGSSMIWPV